MTTQVISDKVQQHLHKSEDIIDIILLRYINIQVYITCMLVIDIPQYKHHQVTMTMNNTVNSNDNNNFN